MTVYEFDHCVLDVDTQQLWSAGELTHIEPQVMRVLEYLAVNADRVVTKMELLDEVWGDRFVSESALTSRIKLARKACGDSGREQRILKTVHGRGYRLVADVRVRRREVTASPADRAQQPLAGARDRASGLAGRTRELAMLDEAVTSAGGGTERWVFVTGEPGVGKSTLLAELIERHEGFDGWLLARGQCLQARGEIEPFFCVLDALTRLASAEPDLVRGTLEQAAPSWLLQMPALVDDELAERLQRRLLGASEHRMLREGVEALHALARSRRMVLALEDLQWIDDCSLDLLEMALGRQEQVPLLVIGTARSTPGAMADAITAATGSGRATEIPLGPLGVDELVQLVTDRFDGADVPDAVLERICQRCDGIPLFAHEILSTWIRQGKVETHDGHVELRVSAVELDATVPPTLSSLIDRELAGMDPDELSVLEGAAVVGDVFDGATVADAIGRPLAEVESLLGAMARRVSQVEARGGSVRPDGVMSTQYAFTHGLARVAIHDRMTVARRVALHDSVGATLEAVHGDLTDDIAVTLAEHFAAAGNAEHAVPWLARAGTQAAARDAHHHAESFFRRALNLIGRLDEDDQGRAELAVRVALGPALVATRGWFGDAVSENYERALELAGQQPPGAEAAAVRYGLATVSELRGQFERTEALLRPVLDAEATGDLAIEAHELVACSTFHQGAFARSMENAGIVLDSWDEDHYSILMARIAEHPASSCNSWLSLSAWMVGRSDESLERAERAIALAERNLYAMSTAAQQRAMLHQLRNEPIACLEWAARTRDVGHQQAFPMRIIQGDIYRGWALAVSGKAEAGMQLLGDGLARFRAEGARLNEAYYLGLHADAHLHAHEPEAALALLDEAIAMSHEHARSYFFDSELWRLRARALLAAGANDIHSARNASDESYLIAKRQGAVALALRTLADRYELEAAIGDLEPWRAQLTALHQSFEGQAPTPDLVRVKALLDA